MDFRTVLFLLEKNICSGPFVGSRTVFTPTSFFFISLSSWAPDAISFKVSVTHFLLTKPEIYS